MNDGYSTECWDGVERRVRNELGTFTKMLDSHVKDEMERYGEIIDRQDQMDNKLSHIEKSQSELSKSIMAFMENHGSFISAIQRAFPKDEEGKPDYDGHKKAHLSWISNAKDEKEVMEFVRKQMKDEEGSKDFQQYVKKVVTAAVAVGLVSWLWAVIWPAIIAGPK